MMYTHFLMSVLQLKFSTLRVAYIRTSVYPSVLYAPLTNSAAIAYVSTSMRD